MPSFRNLAIAVMAVIGSSSRTFAQTPPPGVLVVVGAGFTATWNTKFEVANATASALDLQLNTTPLVVRLCPIGPCPGSVSLGVPPRGTGALLATEVGGIGTASPFLGSLYLVSDSDAGDAATLKALVFDTEVPTRSIELPVFRLSTLLSLNATVLVFPSATRSASTHTNLVLAEVSNTGTLSMIIEVFSAGGQPLGILPVGITADPLDVANRAILMVDVLDRLGVSELEGGQIRVTKLGGDGVMWGLLASVAADRVSVSVGRNP
jgi:hypothetical protein